MQLFRSRLMLPLVAAAGLLSVTQPVLAQAVRTNPGFTTNSLAANDDGSTGLVNIGFTVNLFGLTRSQLYVNNNGNVTFDSSLSTFTPFPINTSSRQMLAPFFADVDTRGAGSSLVTYGSDTVNGRPAFGVNWVNVGYYSAQSDKLNSFQLVMIDRSDIAPGAFDFEFNYNQIRWETGSASGGVNGFGGSSARAGYTNGTTTAGTFYEFPGSAINGAFLDTGPNALKVGMLNSTVAGRYLFTVRGGAISNPGPVNSDHLPTGVVGIGYNHLLTALSGTAPFTWSLAHGALLPPGLFLHSTGQVSGIPTRAGFYSFTAQSVDAGGVTTSRTFNVQILGTLPAPAPVVTPLSITTASPLATAASANFQLQATGGTAPYTFSLVAGALPRPLVLTASGVIAGTPYHAGTYTFTARVTDSAGLTSDKVFTWTVIFHGGTTGLTAGNEGIVSILDANSDGQSGMDFTLSAPAARNYSGYMTLVYTSDDGSDDPSVQFSNNSRSVKFTISAGSNRAVFAEDVTVLLGNGGGRVDLLPTLIDDFGNLSTPELTTNGNSRAISELKK